MGNGAIGRHHRPQSRSASPEAPGQLRMPIPSPFPDLLPRGCVRDPCKLMMLPSVPRPRLIKVGLVPERTSFLPQNPRSSGKAKTEAHLPRFDTKEGPCSVAGEQSPPWDQNVFLEKEAFQVSPGQHLQMEGGSQHLLMEGWIPASETPLGVSLPYMPVASIQQRTLS